MDSVYAQASVSGDDAALDLGEFVRGLAHDIANPLNAIAMNAELAKLLLEREQPERAREVLDRLLADCARCGRWIQGVQRFGSGLHAHPRETISVRVLVDAAIKLAGQERIGDLPAVCVDGVDAPVLVDRPALERAIAGLLHNAAEADAGKIQIQMRGEGDRVLIDIRDDGGGIAPELRARVAESFYSTRRGTGGSGLGLTLACELLRAHGGELDISENMPRGTCIGLRLPRAASPVPHAGNAQD
ncbi:MAG: HAMP domain-containing sensor histidine kinase [Rudaea sp.]|nr:HAMP domain-containing sensor histidine kinase [Rudaea sp.]